MDGTFILHLIRHAPTAGNAARQYIGWTDESVLAFEPLAEPTIEHVWGSDLKRCRQTAELLFPNADYHADRNWRECHFGGWERKTYAELQHDEHYRSWIDDPMGIMPPGGESLTAMSDRIEQAVKALPAGNEFTIVTHGGPIRYLLSLATGRPFQQQTALHGHRHSLSWRNREAFEEGQVCESFSVEPLTANANL